MKLFLILTGMVVAGVLGYIAEPTLRTSITGYEVGKKSPIATHTAPKTGSNAPLVIDPADLANIDPSLIPVELLPTKVTLKSDIKFTNEASGLTMTIAAGSMLNTIRVEGENVLLRPSETSYSIVVPIIETDLKEQLATNPPPAPPVVPEPDPEPEPAPEPEPEPEPVPEPVPAPAPGGDSEEPVPMPEPIVDPQPEPEPQPEPAPEPQPEPEPQPAPVAATETNLVKIMQDSVRAAEIKEFTFDQVLGWKAESEETVDGEVFQTGTVSYKAETIFGVKTIQAKALIRDGKVNRWIWPKSGMVIK